MATSNNQPCRLSVKMIQTFHLVWLDQNVNENNQNCRNSITKLRQVINTVNTFIDADECIDFITDTTEEAAFMIVSQELGRRIISAVKDISQIKSVYILMEKNLQLAEWTNKWRKIKGVYTDIESICEALQKDSKDWDHCAASIGIAKATDTSLDANKDTLHCSFMYTKIMKEILLTIEFDGEHIQEFLNYCRAQLVGNDKELKNLEKFQQEYCPQKSIWWYTSNNLFYSMLNRALRLMDIDIILKMSFFLCDLHKHITELHSKQFRGHISQLNSFIVYRGQALSQIDFNQLKNNQGGLLSFNNFLSTSYDRDVSRAFAESNANDPNNLAVLFRIYVDPTISTTSFANIRGIGNFNQEEEVLFSMHSIFRIGSVEKLASTISIWEVELTLTSDDDSQLGELSKVMQEEIKDLSPWHRLVQLLTKLAQYSKAEELCGKLLMQPTNQHKKSFIFNHMGLINNLQGRYKDAICFYQKSLEISKKTLPENRPHLETSYNNIGLVYDNMGEYSKALEYYGKSLEIGRKTLPPNHPDLIFVYNNIGSVCSAMGEYSKALHCHEKSLEISKKILPADHPDLANVYNNIGLLYNHMGEYSKAIHYHEISLAIQQKSLPANHPYLAMSYNNIGFMYYKMENYSKALHYHEKSLDIQQKTFPANHPYLTVAYNNIGLVYDNMGEYSKALHYHEKSLDIQQKTFPANHPYLTVAYNNIGLVYDNMGEYSKALHYHETSLAIRQKTLPEGHPDLAVAYNNIGTLYSNMGEYSKGLEYFQGSLDIYQRSLPHNHPNIKFVQENIKFEQEKIRRFQNL